LADIVPAKFSNITVFIRSTEVSSLAPIAAVMLLAGQVLFLLVVPLQKNQPKSVN